MLVKIIQKSGVDIENVIDKWNHEIEEEEEKEDEEKEKEEEDEDNNEEKIGKSRSYDSMNDLDGKIDCSSFIPIIMKEKKPEKVIKVKDVPKLNFDAIKKKQQEKNDFKVKNIIKRKRK